MSFLLFSAFQINMLHFLNYMEIGEEIDVYNFVKYIQM